MGVDSQGGGVVYGVFFSFVPIVGYRRGWTAVCSEYLETVVAGIGYDQMISVEDQPAGFGEAAEIVEPVERGARLHSALPDLGGPVLFWGQVPVVVCLLCANFPIEAVSLGGKRALARRDVKNAVGVKAEVRIAERVKGQVVFQILGQQDALGPIGAFERLISTRIVNRGPSLRGQASVRPHPPQDAAVDIRHDQVAVRGQGDLLRQIPPAAVLRQRTAERLVHLGDDQLGLPFGGRRSAEVPHARTGQGWV